MGGGVIALTLTACTTDSVFEDMEQQDDGSQTANSSTDGSGGTTTFSDTGADGYQSFWDIAERREMFYHYRNLTGDNGNPAMLHFKITPSIKILL